MFYKSLLISVLNCHFVLFLSAQNKSELYSGWNHLINVGAAINSNFSLNPRVGQEGNSMQFGLDVEISNINIDSDFIFENSLNINLGFVKNSSGEIELPDQNKVISPFKKNYDFLSLKTKYSKQINYSNQYVAAESFISTQLISSYTDNYLKKHTEEQKLLSQFISPMTGTFSIGYEMRNDFDHVIYFSPFAAKLIYVQNPEIASIPALNEKSDTTIFLGSSLHGNDLEYDTELQEVSSFKKSKLFYGSQLALEFNKDLVPDKLFISTGARFFYNYIGTEKHLDIQTNATIQFTIIPGLSIGLSAEYLNDDNLFFQDLSARTSSDNDRLKLKTGSSYNHRLVLNYSFNK